MLIYRHKTTGTTSSGYWAGNTLYVQGMLCRQVYIKSASTDTVFDVIIEDTDAVPVRKIEDITHIINDLTPFPVVGKLTIKIDSATADEAFTILLCFSEN